MAKSTINQAIATVAYGITAGTTVSVYHSDPVLVYGDRGGLYCVGMLSSRGLNTVSDYQNLTVTLVDNNNFTVKNTGASGIQITVTGAGKITIS